jgi:hypothetical protein
MRREPGRDDDVVERVQELRRRHVAEYHIGAGRLQSYQCVSFGSIQNGDVRAEAEQHLDAGRAGDAGTRDQNSPTLVRMHQRNSITRRKSA